MCFVIFTAPRHNNNNIFQFIPILEKVKESLDEMVSFDHEDVIFLLNKWDTLLEDDEPNIHFEKTLERIKSIWKEAKPTRILKLSMNKVNIHVLFNFKQIVVINFSLMCITVI